MNRARFFDGVDSSGHPFFRPDRFSVTDSEERQRIATFLHGGAIILRTTGHDMDRIDPEKGKVVPLSFCSDGEWIWNEGLAYYVEVYGVTPDADFMTHIRQRDYTPATPDQETSSRALQELEASQRQARPS
jgi:hypothetical protein